MGTAWRNLISHKWSSLLFGVGKFVILTHTIHLDLGQVIQDTTPSVSVVQAQKGAAIVSISKYGETIALSILNISEKEREWPGGGFL